MPPRPTVGHAPFTRSTAPACRRTGPGAGTLRWKQRARGPRIGRGPAPRSRGAGPERPARSTRWRGGPLQPTGPRLRPTSADPAPAPCFSCRGLATSTSTHRKARTNARHGPRNRASDVSREDDRCRGDGLDGVHRARPSTEYPAASARGRPGPGAPCGSRRRRPASRGVAAACGGKTRETPRRYGTESSLDTLHVCAVACCSSMSIVDEPNRRRESC